MEGRLSRGRWRCLVPASFAALILAGVSQASAQSQGQAPQAPAPAPAQAPPPPNLRQYLPNTANEDWSFLKDRSKRTDVWDPVKYIELGREDYFLTLSGEARLRPEGLRIRGVGERPTTTDNYLLQRYLFGADLHLGRNVRMFGELQTGIINGAIRSPRPTDLNHLDLHQGFVEWRRAAPEGPRVVVRAGRMELSVGSSRLISASPGLNVKRAFDGLSAVVGTGAWSLTAAGAKLVGLHPGYFDDSANLGQTFWGVAAARRVGDRRQREAGAYYLGIDQKLSRYAQGAGAELRHTVGFKWSGARGRLDMDYDAIVQWGRFNEAPIRAWGFATETGFRFPASRWRPRISLRSDIASGDQDARDPALQAMNPLFPGNSYSGAVGLLGPTNLTDLTPAVTTMPRRGLIVGFEAPSYWRTSTGDGVYATDQRLLIPPAAGTAKYVGTNPGILVVWQSTPHIQFQGVITRFIPGAFLERTFVAKGFGFYSASAVYRF